MIELELEYVTPDAHLFIAGVSHGILGHPRKFYDTMLQLNRDAVRKEKFTRNYDPYRLIRQPFIILPDHTAESERYAIKSSNNKIVVQTHLYFQSLLATSLFAPKEN